MTRRYRRSSISVEVDVEIDEIMNDLSDEDLIEECQTRKIGGFANGATPFVRDYLDLAYEALLRGKRDEALALLDRLMFPTGATKTADGQLMFKARP